jgi:hypothetical protein
VVTAAHCVANYGKKTFQSGWQFVPGYSNGSAPYGTWTVAFAYVLTSYYDGTDPCAQSGVVCQDDVAVLVLNPQSGKYVGSTVGWFGYEYGGGFTSAGLAAITQLGYPGGLDSALYMERTDSQAYTSSSSSNNHVIGSNQNQGSSGGPWVENFGLPSALTGETSDELGRHFFKSQTSGCFFFHFKQHSEVGDHSVREGSGGLLELLRTTGVASEMGQPRSQL